MARSNVVSVALVATTMTLIASPALAKGAESVTLTGPGIGRPIKLDTTDTGLLGRAMTQTGLWWSTRGDRPLPLEGPPPGELGPGYTLTWILYGEDVVIRQVVYPFAQGGVVVHTPIQEWVRGRAEGAGWFDAPALQTTLARLGVPLGGGSSASDALHETAGRSPGRRAAAAPLYFAVVSLGLVAALAVALVAGRALRRRTQRQRVVLTAEPRGALRAR
jgi:hypothetical protein